MIRVLRILWASFWYLLATGLILAAILLSVARLLLPLTAEYREEVEAMLGEYLEQPVRIQSMDAKWVGLAPVLMLEHVDLLDPDGSETLVHFEQAFVGVDLVALLRSGEFIPGVLGVEGVSLSVTRHEDGRITVEGLHLEGTHDPEQAQELLMQWLLDQPGLSIRHSDLEWNDLATGRSLHFSDISLQLANDGDRHQLDGRVNLPASLGTSLRFAADFVGDPGKSTDWEGKLFVEGREVAVARLLEGQALRDVRVDAGTADFSIWLERDGDHSEISGHLKARELELKAVNADAPPAQLQYLNGDFAWSGNDEQWRLDVDKLIVVREGRAWPGSALRIEARPGEDSYTLSAGFLQVRDVAHLLLASGMLDERARDMLVTARPGAELYNLQVRYAGQRPLAERLDIRGRFRDLQFASWQDVPAMQGLDGVLHATALGGTLDLDCQTAKFDLPFMFREPLQVSSISGRLAWEQTGQGWQVSAGDLQLGNADLAMTMSMVLELPDDGSSPYINLVGHYQDGDGSSVSRYLPVSIMSKRVIDWLDRAVVSGEVTWGAAVLRGRLGDFPFENGEGKFETRFNVTNAILDYAPGWPRLEEIDAEVAFSGSRMEIRADSARMLGVEVEDVSADIPRLRGGKPVLHIAGRAFGTTGDALEFVAKSPLDDTFGHHLEGLEVNGHSDLKLELTIPIGRPDVKVQGELRLSDSRIDVTDWDIRLDDINGSLVFTEDDMHGEGISARLLGKPAKVKVHTSVVRDEEQKPGRRSLVVEAETRMELGDLFSNMQLPILRRMQGETDWKLTLDVPRAEWRDEIGAQLSVTSALEGVEVDLPAPFGKSPSQKRNFAFSTRLMTDPAGLSAFPRRAVGLDYGHVHSVFLIEERPDGVAVDRGEINIGGEPGDLPEPGVHIRGSIPELSLQQWADYLLPQEPTGEGVSAAELGGYLSSVDLLVGRLKVLGYPFDGARLQVRREDLQWNASVESEHVTGKASWQQGGDAAPVVVELEKLVLEKKNEEADAGTELDEPIDPREVPPLQVTIGELQYNEIRLGKARLVATPQPEGLNIDEFRLEFNEGHMDGSGTWSARGAGHATRLRASFKSEDLGETLTRMGFAGSIDGGTADSEIAAEWRGSPAGFSVAGLDGHVKVKLRKGIILAVEPGAGRMFGLLSLSTLPRRLALDFSDLFKKGFAFDKIDGEFSIDQGDAYTNDLVIKGPAATVNLSGRTGLASQDYDQLVTVTPKVTASLPVAGALVGGPAVGAAILAIEQIFKPTIDQITRYHYTIVGPWDAPLIERLEGEEPLEGEDTEPSPVS